MEHSKSMRRTPIQFLQGADVRSWVTTVIRDAVFCGLIRQQLGEFGELFLVKESSKETTQISVFQKFLTTFHPTKRVFCYTCFMLPVQWELCLNVRKNHIGKPMEVSEGGRWMKFAQSRIHPPPPKEPENLLFTPSDLFVKALRTQKSHCFKRIHEETLIYQVVFEPHLSKTSHEFHFHEYAKT